MQIFTYFTVFIILIQSKSSSFILLCKDRKKLQSAVVRAVMARNPPTVFARLYTRDGDAPLMAPPLLFYLSLFILVGLCARLASCLRSSICNGHRGPNLLTLLTAEKRRHQSSPATASRNISRWWPVVSSVGC